MREFDALLRRKGELAKDAVKLACLTGGLAAAASYNAAGATKESGERFSAMDFMPNDEKPKSPDESTEETLHQVKLLNIMMGGKGVVSE